MNFPIKGGLSHGVPRSSAQNEINITGRRQTILISYILSLGCVFQPNVKGTILLIRKHPQQIKTRLPFHLPPNNHLLHLPPKLKPPIQCLVPKSPSSSIPCMAMSPSVCPSYTIVCTVIGTHGSLINSR